MATLDHTFGFTDQKKSTFRKVSQALMRGATGGRLGTRSDLWRLERVKGIEPCYQLPKLRVYLQTSVVSR